MYVCVVCVYVVVPVCVRESKVNCWHVVVFWRSDLVVPYIVKVMMLSSCACSAMYTIWAFYRVVMCLAANH